MLRACERLIVRSPSEAEYYLVVGILNDTACAIPAHERAALQLLVVEYEAQPGR